MLARSIQGATCSSLKKIEKGCEIRRILANHKKQK